MTPAATSLSRRRIRRTAPLAFSIYLAAVLVLFGAPLWHPGECLCGETPDAGTFAWAMDWWPHAIAHGENPFFPKTIFAPDGINLAHGQLVPAAALIMAPVTAIGGPLFSMNLALLLSPVLAAFFAFLLCRRLTGQFWAALAGGWLFGFSSYLLAQMTSHLNLALVFPIPAVVLLAVQRADGDISRRRFIILTTLALAALFGFSPEVFVSFAGFGALALALAVTTHRRRLLTLTAELAGALAATAVVVSPYLYYAQKPGILPPLPWRTEKFSNDLLSFVVPTRATSLGGERFAGTTDAFTAGLVEGSAYLGPPLLVLVALALVAGRRRPATRILGGVLAVAAVLSLGARLHVDADRSVHLPWAAFNQLPVTGQIIPARLSVYVVLAAAILTALWLADQRGRIRVVGWALVAASVVTLLPALDTNYWRNRPEVPALFTDDRYADVLTEQDTVLMPPIGIAGNSMLWLARSRLDFKLAGGYVVAPEAPDPYKGDPLYPTLTYNAPIPNLDAAARSFVERKNVTAVVIAETDPGGLALWVPLMERLGWTAETVGGATVLRPPG